MKSLWHMQKDLQDMLTTIETAVKHIKELNTKTVREQIREEVAREFKVVLEEEKPYLPDDVRRRLEEKNLIVAGTEEDIVNDETAVIEGGDTA